MNIKYIITKLAVAVVMMLAFVFQAFAQNTLSGRVTDENGDPMPGVYVAVKGTQNATSTDADGNFTLRTNATSGTLVFSMMGMTEQEIPIGGQSLYNVIMKEDTTMLEETVVVGYGTMIKRELTASISQVGGEALTERATGLNVLQNMAGKMAGVQIKSTSGRPGGNTAILIRGIGSINASTTPLYVVDGAVDVNPDMINSNDIESVSVLKDAASAAMYGAKGANGVVLITTKSGQGSGQGTITYDGKYGVGYLSRKLHLMNSDEYIQMQQLAYGYSGQNMPHLVTPIESLFNYQMNGSEYARDEKGLLIATPKYNTDWWSEVTRKAITQDHNVSFAQRGGKSSVYANLGWQDVQGLVKTTYGKRLSATINATTQINKWLDLNAMVSYSKTESNSADQEGTMQQGAVRNTYEMPPVVPVKYPDGTWGAKQDYPLSETASNPVHQLNAWKQINRRNYFLGNIGLDFHLLEGLTFTVKGNYQTTNSKDTDFRIAGMADWSKSDSGTQAYISNNLSNRWSNEDYFTYDKLFFNERLKSNFTLGASWYYSQAENSYAGSQLLPDDVFEYHDLGSGTKKVQPSSGWSKNTMNSYYFRTNQIWDGRYMLGVTVRVDGASNFGAKRKYGFFPSVSAGWTVSEEPWFGTDKNFINHLKLRASFGEVGNASIGNYATMSQISAGTMIMNDQIVSQSSVSTLGNTDLSWETTRQVDAGLDIAFFKDRIQLIADWYYKKSLDLLFAEAIPHSSGYGSITSNLGVLHNTGFEVTLNTHPIATRKFAWDLDFIYSTNQCIIDKLYGSLSTHGGQVEEGQPYMRWGMKKLLGTWSTEEAAEAAVYGRSPGDYKLEDVNQNGEYDDGDTQYVGMATPKGEISIVNNFTWGGFNLMVDIGSAWGFKVSNVAQSLYVGQAIYTNSLSDLLTSSWTPDNQNTTLAQLRLPTDAYFGNGSMGTFFLEDGDFIRVRNIVLSYDLKRDLLKNMKSIKGMLLGVSIENPFLWTKYTGFDPEVGWGTGNGQISYDWLAYPKPTTITGNIKISF